MNIAFAVWSIFCIGASLLAASGPRKITDPKQKTMQSFGFGAILWVAGVVVWMVAGALVASALN